MSKNLKNNQSTKKKVEEKVPRKKKNGKNHKKTPPNICTSCGKLLKDCRCMEDFLTLVSLLGGKELEIEQFKNKEPEKKNMRRLTSRDFILNDTGKQIENLDDFINILNHKDAPEQQKLLVSNLQELNNLIGMEFIKQQIINQLLFFMQDMVEPGTFLHTVITGSPGVGKCLGYNTEVMMYNGDVKKVQDIKKGDKLMGDDLSPRNVLSICTGKETMFLVKQTNGMNYVVNESHILSLKDENFNIIDISVKDYIRNYSNNGKCLKGYKILFDMPSDKILSVLSDIKIIKVDENYYKQGKEYEYYYGFEIDGNRRFLLGDFTVTHNTSLINILAKIYNNIGLLKTDKVLKADRSDLVAEYLGQTAVKTKNVLIKATGGILLIDEAYSLGSGNSGENRDSFAKECVDTLNQYLTEHVDELVCIIAGYEDDIEKCFFKQNSGLHRRFPWRFHINDYSVEELCEILYKQLGSWNIECDKKYVIEKIRENVKYFDGNGGDTRNLLDKCKILHARRNFKQIEINKKIHTDTPVPAPAPVLKKLSRKRIKENSIIPPPPPLQSQQLPPPLQLQELQEPQPLQPLQQPSRNRSISIEDFDSGMKNFILSKKKETKLCTYCKDYSNELKERKNCEKCLEKSKKSIDTMYI